MIKNILITFFLISGFYSTPGLAVEIDQILGQMHEGRIQCLDAIEELERQTIQIDHPEPAFELLRRISEIRTAVALYDFSYLGENPLNNWIETYAQFIAKWIEFDRTPTDDLKSFLELGSLNGLYNALFRQEQYLLNSIEPAKISLWMQKTNIVIDYTRADELLVRALSDVASFQARIITHSVSLYMDNKLDDDFIASIFSQVRTEEGFSEVAAFIREETITIVTPEAASKGAKIISAYVLAQNDAAIEMSAYLKEFAGDAIAQLLNAIVLKQIDVSTVSHVPASLLSSAAKIKLANALSGLPVSQILLSQAGFISAIAEDIAEDVANFASATDLANFRKVTTQIAILLLEEDASFEGQYAIEINQKPAKMTVVKIGASQFIVGLIEGDINTAQKTYSLMKVIYRAESHDFHAHYGETSDPDFRIPNWPHRYITIKFEKQTDAFHVSGVFSDGYDFQEYQGEKIQDVRSFIGPVAHPVADPTAVYEGFSTDNHKLRLVLSLVGKRLVGTLWFLQGFSRIDLNFGIYNDRTGAFFVTSDAEIGQSWIHVRGRVTGDNITIDYVAGGKGKVFEANLSKSPGPR